MDAVFPFFDALFRLERWIFGRRRAMCRYGTAKLDRRTVAACWLFDGQIFAGIPASIDTLCVAQCWVAKKAKQACFFLISMRKQEQCWHESCLSAGMVINHVNNNFFCKNFESHTSSLAKILKNKK